MTVTAAAAADAEGQRNVQVGYLAVVVNAWHKAVKIKEVKGCAEGVTHGGQAGRLQVLQLTHKGSVVLLPTSLQSKQWEALGQHRQAETK